MGISSGMAYRLANELSYEPKDPHIRHLLGLPTLIPVPACPVSAMVHLRKSCPRSNGHRRSSSVNLGKLTDEEHAMIAALTPAERKKLLIEAIKEKIP